jgi:hypothetical protein
VLVMGTGIPGGYTGMGTPGTDKDTSICTHDRTRTLTRHTHTHHAGFGFVLCEFSFICLLISTRFSTHNNVNHAANWTITVNDLQRVLQIVRSRCLTWWVRRNDRLDILSKGARLSLDVVLG